MYIGGTVKQYRCLLKYLAFHCCCANASQREGDLQRSNTAGSSCLFPDKLFVHVRGWKRLLKIPRASYSKEGRRFDRLPLLWGRGVGSQCILAWLPTVGCRLSSWLVQIQALVFVPAAVVSLLFAACGISPPIWNNQNWLAAMFRFSQPHAQRQLVQRLPQRNSFFHEAHFV